MNQPDAIAAEVTKILHTQEMRGERLINHIRAGFFAMSLAALVGTFSVNTPEANNWFVVQIGSALAYAGLVYVWFWRNNDTYARWLKYVSITVDLVLLHMAALIMSLTAVFSVKGRPMPPYSGSAEIPIQPPSAI